MDEFRVSSGHKKETWSEAVEDFYGFMQGHLITTLSNVQQEMEDHPNSALMLEREQLIAFYSDVLTYYDYLFLRMIETVCCRNKAFLFPPFSSIPVCDDCREKNEPMRLLVEKAGKV